MDIFQIIALATAATGAIPLTICAINAEMVLLFADGAVTISGVIYTTAQHNNATWVDGKQMVVESRKIASLVEAAVASAAVLFTLAAIYRVSGHRTLVGLFRALWLIVIVTSSCSYVTIKAINPQLAPAIPNDLTIIALGVGFIFLCGALCASMCRGTVGTGRDDRVIATEILLIVGALSIRYQSNLDAILERRTQVGWTVWYACCHILVLVIVYLTQTSSTNTKNESDLSTPSLTDI